MSIYYNLYTNVIIFLRTAVFLLSNFKLFYLLLLGPVADCKSSIRQRGGGYFTTLYPCGIGKTIL